MGTKKMIFEKVADPLRVRQGDLVVFPAGHPLMKSSVSTIAKHGVSVGGTRRSMNSPRSVNLLFRSKSDTGAAFVVADVAENHTYVGMSSTNRIDAGRGATPIVSAAVLVPYDPGSDVGLAYMAGPVEYREAVLAACGPDRLTISDVSTIGGSVDGLEDRIGDIPVRIAGSVIRSFSAVPDIAFSGGFWHVLHSSLHDKNKRLVVSGEFIADAARSGVKVVRPAESARRSAACAATAVTCRRVRSAWAKAAVMTARTVSGLKSDAKAVGAEIRALDAKASELGRKAGKATAAAVAELLGKGGGK